MLTLKPEQEHLLLERIVNKFADTDAKISSLVQRLLGAVTQKQPEMKTVVAREVERFVRSPGSLSTRAKYCATLFLTEMPLDRRFDLALSLQLVLFYAHVLGQVFGDSKLATKVLATTTSTSSTSSSTSSSKKGSSKGSNKGKGKGSGKASSQANSSSGATTLLDDSDNRLVRCVLVGIKRAIPYLSPEADIGIFNEMVESLFRVCHTVSAFSTRVSLLGLLRKILLKQQQSRIMAQKNKSSMPNGKNSSTREGDKKDESSETTNKDQEQSCTATSQEDRYYRLVYEQLRHFELLHTGNQLELMNLLREIVKEDSDRQRSVAMLRRLFQLSAHVYSQAPGVSGLLIARDASNLSRGGNFDELSKPVGASTSTDTASPGSPEKKSATTSIKSSTSSSSTPGGAKEDVDIKNESSIAAQNQKKGEDSTSSKKSSEQADSTSSALSTDYDSNKRDPRFANALGALVWELHAMGHHVDPTLRSLASSSATCPFANGLQIGTVVRGDHKHFLDTYALELDLRAGWDTTTSTGGGAGGASNVDEDGKNEDEMDQDAREKADSSSDQKNKKNKSKSTCTGEEQGGGSSSSRSFVDIARAEVNGTTRRGEQLLPHERFLLKAAKLAVLGVGGVQKAMSTASKKKTAESADFGGEDEEEIDAFFDDYLEKQMPPDEDPDADPEWSLSGGPDDDDEDEDDDMKDDDEEEVLDEKAAEALMSGTQEDDDEDDEDVDSEKASQEMMMDDEDADDVSDLDENDEDESSFDLPEDGDDSEMEEMNAKAPMSKTQQRKVDRKRKRDEAAEARLDPETRDRVKRARKLISKYSGSAFADASEFEEFLDL
ncbi:unnamed protein product [Amoebophrya sp. A25]|nr:unnamed protein product [Amoebophrya sp. A25]|eukprot:GSA25T00011177001.1